MTEEPRVYLINASDMQINFRKCEQADDHEAIIAEAERLGTVYSLEFFQDEINNEEIDLSNSFIFIYPKKFGGPRRELLTISNEGEGI